MRVPLATVRKLLAELSAAGEVVMCQMTRYEGSKTTAFADAVAHQASPPIRNSPDRGLCRALFEAFERNGDLRCRGAIANA